MVRDSSAPGSVSAPPSPHRQAVDSKAPPEGVDPRCRDPRLRIRLTIVRNARFVYVMLAVWATLPIGAVVTIVGAATSSHVGYSPGDDLHSYPLSFMEVGITIAGIAVVLLYCWVFPFEVMPCCISMVCASPRWCTIVTRLLRRLASAAGVMTLVAVIVKLQPKAVGVADADGKSVPNSPVSGYVTTRP